MKPEESDSVPRKFQLARLQRRRRIPVATYFSYSIGITKSCGAPEIIVVGLDENLGHWLVNEYNRRVSSGETFAFDRPYPGFLEGLEVRFGQVAEEHRKEYMRSTCWLYDGPTFEAVQLIWPNTSGIWPWDPEASEQFRASQPILFGGQPQDVP
jgi:hypothetical protein